MKSQRGVTAVSMAIVIVLIILLTGYSVLSSRDVVNEANVQKYYQEIKVISDNTISMSVDKHNFRETFNTFKIDDISKYNNRVGNRLVENKTYYLLPYGEDSMNDVMKQSLNEILDVRNVENSYIISLEDTGKVEVLLVDGVRVGDNYLYTYSEIHDSYSNVTKK